MGKEHARRLAPAEPIPDTEADPIPGRRRTSGVLQPVPPVSSDGGVAVADRVASDSTRIRRAGAVTDARAPAQPEQAESNDSLPPLAERLLARPFRQATGTGSLMGGVDPGRAWHTGSSQIKLGFAVQLTGGIAPGPAWLKLGLSASPGVSLSGSLNVQDDRRFRANLSVGLSLGGSGAASVLAKAGVKGLLGFGVTGVFRSIEAMSHYVWTRIQLALHQIWLKVVQTNAYVRALGDGAQATLASPHSERVSRVGLATARLANDAKRLGPTIAVTGALGVEASGELAQAAGLTVAAGVDRTRFYAYDPEKRMDDPDGQTGRYVLTDSHSKSATITPSFKIPGVGVGVSATVKATDIENHPNPDNDGTYLTITLKMTGEGLLPGVMMSVAAGMIQNEFRVPPGETVRTYWKHLALAARLREPGKALKQLLRSGTKWDNHASLLNELKKTSTFAAAPSLPLDGGPPVSVSRSVSVSGDWNLVWAGGQFRLQYLRVSREQHSKITGGHDFQVAPGAAVGLEGSLESTETRSLGETIGTNTLSYVQTVFNGLMGQQNGSIGDAAWASFVDHHRPALAEICRNVGVRQVPSLTSEVIGVSREFEQRCAAAYQDDPLLAGRDPLSWYASHRLESALTGYLGLAKSATAAESRRRSRVRFAGTMHIRGRVLAPQRVARRGVAYRVAYQACTIEPDEQTMPTFPADQHLLLDKTPAEIAERYDLRTTLHLEVSDDPLVADGATITFSTKAELERGLARYGKHPLGATLLAEANRELVLLCPPGRRPELIGELPSRSSRR